MSDVDEGSPSPAVLNAAEARSVRSKFANMFSASASFESVRTLPDHALDIIYGRSGESSGCGTATSAVSKERGPAGVSSEDGGVDSRGFDENQQRVLLERHMDRLGLYDFLGFEFSFADVSGESLYEEVEGLSGAGSGRLTHRESATGAFVTLVKSFIGIGILSLPYATLKGGYVGAPVGIIIIAFVAHMCMQRLLKTAQAVDGVSFGAVGRKVVGIWGKRAVEYCLVASQVGFCIAYIIFISENVSDVICIETKKQSCISPAWYTVGTMALLLPFVWLKSLNALVIPTLMANFALIGGILWVFYCAAKEGTSDRGFETHDLIFLNGGEYPVFFGLAVFTFEGIGLILPIRHIMAEPQKMEKLVTWAVTLLTVLFCCFGVICYIAYGAATQAMITFNLPTHKLTSFLRLFYSLGILFSYPVMMLPVFQLVEVKFKGFFMSESLGGPNGKRKAFRAAVVVGTGCIGMLIPHFGLFLGLVGSVCCTLLAFVLPAWFHLRRPDRKGEEDAIRKEDMIDKAIIAFGFAAGLTSFSFTVREFFREDIQGGHR